MVVPGGYKRKRGEGHILVDEEYVEEVLQVATSRKFPGVASDSKHAVEALKNVSCDDPDKAGLVALSFSGKQDPGDVVTRIRDVDPSLYDMVAPDHTVGVRVNPDTGEVATSPEAGGPAGIPAKRSDDKFEYRTDDDVAGSGVMVGVVDSGIRRHWWYEGAVLSSPGSLERLDADRDRKRDALAGHGTFVAGLILLQAPAATVRVVGAFDPKGFVLVRTAANAIVDLDQRGADIINLSFGGYTRKNRMPLAHRKAFSKLRDGTVVVAAAGNHVASNKRQREMMDRRFWPAAMKRVVAVAALDADQSKGVRLANFSNFGPWVTIAAPGADLLSTFVFDKDVKGWATWSGTSFAAPIVAGRIAAAMTNDKGEIVLTAKQAKEMVMEEARKAAASSPLTINGSGPVPVVLSAYPERPVTSA